MLQRGIDTSDMDVTWVSSLSLYFLALFGLNSVFRLILGDDNGKTSRLSYFWLYIFSCMCYPFPQLPTELGICKTWAPSAAQEGQPREEGWECQAPLRISRNSSLPRPTTSTSSTTSGSVKTPSRGCYGASGSSKTSESVHIYIHRQMFHLKKMGDLID
jgi:hypothetical protein